MRGSVGLVSCGVVSLLPFLAHAGEYAESAAAAKQTATAMYAAFLRGDLSEFASHTYPPVIRMMGGKEEMILRLRKGQAEMASQGFAFKSVSVGAPLQVVTAGQDLHTLLPMTVVMTAPGGELHGTGYLPGISGNKGHTWTFVDLNRDSQESVRKVVPTFELRIPEIPKPVFIPK